MINIWRLGLARQLCISAITRSLSLLIAHISFQFMCSTVVAIASAGLNWYWGSVRPWQHTLHLYSFNNVRYTSLPAAKFGDIDLPQQCNFDPRLVWPMNFSRKKPLLTQNLKDSFDRSDFVSTWSIIFVFLCKLVSHLWLMSYRF